VPVIAEMEPVLDLPLDVDGLRVNCVSMGNPHAVVFIDAPVEGVLSEGDRRDAKRVAAPPLESPLGRLLFGEPIAALRGRAAAGLPIDEARLLALWRETRLLQGRLAARVVGAPQKR